MFTYICPKCGREVPPSYTECPDCAEKPAGAEPVASAIEETPVRTSTPRPQAPPPPVEQAPPPPAARRPEPPPPPYEASHAQSPLFAAPQPVERRAGGPALPTWALAVLFAFAFLGLGLGVFWLITHNRASNRAIAAATNVDSPAAKPGAKVNALQKWIEVSAIRFSQDKDNKKVVNVTFVVVNHSDTDVDRLTGNVTVWGRTRASEEDAVGNFAFMLSLGAGASKELVLPFNTKLKFAELPDWQNITADTQITGPATY
jgi:hypothetical protein